MESDFKTSQEVHKRGEIQIESRQRAKQIIEYSLLLSYY
jgi:hypothetical protein